MPIVADDGRVVDLTGAVGTGEPAPEGATFMGIPVVPSGPGQASKPDDGVMTKLEAIHADIRKLAGMIALRG